MYKIIDVKALEKYKIQIKFSDGVEGNVDLSDLAGKGVFACWKDPKQFNNVAIDPKTHTVCWPGGIDLCPDSLYNEIISRQSNN